MRRQLGSRPPSSPLKGCMESIRADELSSLPSSLLLLLYSRSQSLDLELSLSEHTSAFSPNQRSFCNGIPFSESLLHGGRGARKGTHRDLILEGIGRRAEEELASLEGAVCVVVVEGLFDIWDLGEEGGREERWGS